jgi:hypothetical protein
MPLVLNSVPQRVDMPVTAPDITHVVYQVSCIVYYLKWLRCKAQLGRATPPSAMYRLPSAICRTATIAAAEGLGDGQLTVEIRTAP